MAYVPPFRRQQKEEAAAPQPEEELDLNRNKGLQLELWEALRRGITSAINKASALNMEGVAIEAFRENLVRGRGVFCKAIMRAQSLDEEMTPVFACLVAIINKELPEVGELLLKRLVVQWRRLHRRKDHKAAATLVSFIAHLTVQRVQEPLLVLKILASYLCKPDGAPSDDELSVAASLFRSCYRFLEQEDPTAFHVVLEPMRELLRGNQLSTRGEALLERLLADVKDWQTKKNSEPVVPAALDLVDEGDQNTHCIDIDGDYDIEAHLDSFTMDPKFEENETAYDAIRERILGDLAVGIHNLGDDDDALSEDGEANRNDSETKPLPAPPAAAGIVAPSSKKKKSALSLVATTHADDDEPEVDYVDDPDGADGRERLDDADDNAGLSDEEVLKLRKAMFLIMKNSMRAEEVVHKFFKHIPQLARHESVAASLLLEACYREKVYNRFYPLIADRMCKINSVYQKAFAKLFTSTYVAKLDELSERDIDKVAWFFAALLKADAISWAVFAVVILTEESTTASQRIFLKALFQGLAEAMGIGSVCNRLRDPKLQDYTQGLFPKDALRHTRFAADFYEQVGVGAIGDELRVWYEQQRKRPREE